MTATWFGMIAAWLVAGGWAGLYANARHQRDRARLQLALTKDSLLRAGEAVRNARQVVAASHARGWHAALDAVAKGVPLDDLRSVFLRTGVVVPGDGDPP